MQMIHGPSPSRESLLSFMIFKPWNNAWLFKVFISYDRVHIKYFYRNSCKMINVYLNSTLLNRCFITHIFLKFPFHLQVKFLSLKIEVEFWSQKNVKIEIDLIFAFNVKKVYVKKMILNDLSCHKCLGKKPKNYLE